MKQATNMYKYLRTQTGSFYEVKIIRGNTTYGMDKLKSIRISQALFQDTGPQVGGVNSSKCVVELRETSYNWPRMAQFEVQYRIVSEDEQDKDSWMSFGFFYTDQRKGSKNGTLKIVAYDAMLKTEQSWTDKANLPLNFPITARHAASLLAEAFDIEFEDLQSLDNDTRYIGRNDSDTARDVLKSIAVGCGGNWYVTPAGKFRLVRLINRDISNIPAIAGLAIADITKVNDANTDITPPFIAGVAIVGVSVVGTFAGEQAEEYNIIQVGLSAKSFESNVITSPVTGVEIESSTGNIAFAGSREGYVIKASCSFANSAIASMCLSKVRGYIYTPFEAKSARLDPIAEIGDYAIVDSSACPIITLEWNICKKPTADMSAPFEEEVDHEYTTISEKAKNYKKLVEATKDETRTAIEQSEESIKLYATQTFVDKVTYESELQRLSDQIDGAIETWQGNAVPTLNNLPASEWSNDEDKAAHVGDLYLVETSYDGPEAGHYYRFEKNGNTYSWEQLSDTMMTLALNQAIAAADAAERATLLAEGLENTISQKAKVFVKDDRHANPTPPYYVGDLWITGDSILTCIRTREEGSFNSTDWQKKDTYVDSALLDATVTTKVNAALEVAADSISASVEETVINNLSDDFLTTEGGIKSSFGWELTSTEHAWYANGKKVMSVDANGLAVEGEIRATSGYIGTANSGFAITSSSIRKDMESLTDTEHNGVYIGTDGIALGAGNFKVTSSGAATMKNLEVTGGSISIGQYVDGDGNAQPTFYVSSDGSLYAENGVFNGTIYASNIVGAVSEQQLADAIQSAISAARNYAAVTATQLAPSTTIPPYFRAGQIVARESFYSDNYYVDTGNDSTEFDLANHYHNITANDSTGVVTIGAPVKNNGTPPSFNIAATSFYQNNVAAARTSGANSVEIKSNADNGIRAVTNSGEWDREVNITESNKTSYSSSDNLLYGYVNIALTNDKTYTARVGITPSKVPGDGTISVSRLNITSATNYDASSSTSTNITGSDSISGKPNYTVTATGTVKVNNEYTYSNVALDITGIMDDLYLRRFSVSVRDYNSSTHRLYLRSNYEVRLDNGSTSELILDIYDTGDNNSVDISDYVSGSVSQRTATSLAYVTNDNDETDWSKINVTYDDGTTTPRLSISPNAYNAGRNSYTAISKSITENGTYSPQANERWSSVVVNVPSSGSASHSINPNYSGWTDYAKQYNFIVNNSDAGYVRIERSGNTILGYYANSQSGSDIADELFVFSGGSTPNYTISNVDWSVGTFDEDNLELPMTFTFDVDGISRQVSGDVGVGKVYRAGQRSAGGSASHDPDCRKEFMGSQYTIYISNDEYFEAYRITPTCGGEDGTPFYAYLYHSP